MSRVAEADYTDRKTGQVIEKGMHVMIPIAAIQNDPDIYPDPNRFDPDRMTTDKMKARHPCSFMPFGAGPRICIGIRMA